MQLHLYRALWGAIATAVSVQNEDVRIGLVREWLICLCIVTLLTRLQLLAIWRRFVAPRLNAVVFQVRSNPSIGTRDGARVAKEAPRAEQNTGSSENAEAGSLDVPPVRDTGALVLYQAWCTGLFKATSALLRVSMMHHTTLDATSLWYAVLCGQNLLRVWGSVEDEDNGLQRADSQLPDDEFVQQCGDELGLSGRLVCVSHVLRHLTLTLCLAAARERCLNAHVMAMFGEDDEWLTMQAITTPLVSGAADATGPGELTPHLDIDPIAAGVAAGGVDVDLVSPGAFGFGEVQRVVPDGIAVEVANKPRLKVSLSTMPGLASHPSLAPPRLCVSLLWPCCSLAHLLPSTWRNGCACLLKQQTVIWHATRTVKAPMPKPTPFSRSFQRQMLSQQSLPYLPWLVRGFA